MGAGRDYESEESEESESVVVGTLAQLARAWQELRVLLAHASVLQMTSNVPRIRQDMPPPGGALDAVSLAGWTAFFLYSPACARLP